MFFKVLTLLAHAMVFHCFSYLSFLGNSQVIVKNAETVGKKKKQKAKKPLLLLAADFLIFRPSKHLKTFGDKLKVAC